MYESLEVFDKRRRIIEYDTVESLLTILREYRPLNITAETHCCLEELYIIQVSLKKMLLTSMFLR